MTDAEKLAIAEEILKSIDAEREGTDLYVHMDCLYLRRTNFHWYAHKPCSGCEAKKAIASNGNAVDCVIAARQKLAAEAEAALPECAKRWRDALKEIQSLPCGEAPDARSIARKALQGENRG